jgi:hypothetical protein
MPNGADQINLLFRFRDLTDHTIARHREVIAASGQCWWGWWKRPTEQDRREDWNFLAQ